MGFYAGIKWHLDDLLTTSRKAWSSADMVFLLSVSSSVCEVVTE